jgi:hypothetical protein
MSAFFRPVAPQKFLSFLFALRSAYRLQHLALRVTTTARVEHAVVERYAGWDWGDLKEQALIDDLTGLNRPFHR